MRMNIAAGALAALVLAPPALAQESAAAPCPAVPVAPPPALAGWGARTPLHAAGDPHGLAMATLAIGKGADVSLLPTPQVRYAIQPEKPGGSVSHGGLLAFTVSAAGIYRVALGGGAWIDVVRDGKAAVSTAHGHGPACTGMMKMVDFPLTPGRYVLQVSANAGETLSILIAPAD